MPMAMGPAVLSKASLWYLGPELFSGKPVLVVIMILDSTIGSDSMVLIVWLDGGQMVQQ